ncbi:MAG: LysR family transcriptional regulator [Moraxellaceae bacterium]|nr:LysR family transcriptional regulator [Moraxellaceae bacterium]MBP8851690.1 LysR family transcriptional regulator [Moraxellaceae bacterium]MBP9044690.1 LysR family transcriptional regulator [Moraxellaceae bacterium]MBP9729832.1 LysR family transcriptional regulator [Moraxellaceae bacterium]
MDLNDVAVFERVVIEGSLTGAAARLGQTKSSVSRSLARLEESLGVRLLQRTTRKLNLTEAGQIFFDRTRRVLGELRDAERAVTQPQESPRGHLRITMPVELGMQFMGRVVAEFMQQHPEVTIEAELSGRVVNLVEEGFDLAFRIGELPDSSLVARKLGNLNGYFYASPAYLGRFGVPKKPEDLAAHDVILFMQPKENSVQLMRQGKSGKYEPSCQLTLHGRLTVNNIGMACDAAVAGIGIALMPKFLSANVVSAGQLMPVLPDYVVLHGGLYVMYPSRDHVPTALRTFIDFVTVRVREHPWFE